MSDPRLALPRGTALLAAALLATACSDSPPAPTALDQVAIADPAHKPAAPPARTEAAPDYAAALKEVPAGEFDPLTIPMANGIVWYGTWEDAVAEVERTGKPLMLHMGSPRCPNGTVCVPGTW